MPSWNPDQYLKFEAERTQPCRDLAARLALPGPRRIVDLGCGPGNSTVVLAERWTDAEITGVDQSAEMIQAARAKYPAMRWQESDISTWAAAEPVDLLFSNAALHWVGDHHSLLPRLFDQVTPGGALAWQVPADRDAPAHRLMRVLAGSAARSSRFTGTVRDWFSQPLSVYYDLLAPRAARLELWQTEYVHILESPAAIVEWYKGTGLRPFLDRLDSDEARAQFLGDYLQLIESAFTCQEDGRVLFPFLRQFVIAYRR